MLQLYHGNCTEILKSIPDSSIDAVISDPPYPCIKRDYGYWTADEWHALMKTIVSETRRVLRPTGSAMFVLQPNSEKIGKMRSWLWDFMSWVSKEWNIVQDAWWWNPSTLPTIHCTRNNGLMRPSLKACVWLGEPNCYRNQDEILWSPSDALVNEKRCDRVLIKTPSSHSIRRQRIKDTSAERGGVTPFNVIPVANTDSTNKHSASTPKKLCQYWIKYITRPGDTVLDPFCGGGSIGTAALELERNFIGIEQNEHYYEYAKSILEHKKPLTRDIFD